MCEKCEMINNNKTFIELPSDNNFYEIKNGSKVFIISEKENSLSINDKDGSINEVDHTVDFMEKDVVFEKSWLKEVFKIKNKTYIVFYHKHFKNLITEYDNVRPYKSLVWGV